MAGDGLFFIVAPGAVSSSCSSMSRPSAFIFAHSTRLGVRVVLVRNSSAAPSAKSMRPVASPKPTVDSGGVYYRNPRLKGDKAGKKGVQILCLQEIFNGPYFCPSQDRRWYDAAEAVPGPTLAAHCKVTGRMNERTSAADGQSYAIGFQMRLPKAWNGRFFHQGNGGIDGSVVTATGSFGGGPLTSAPYAFARAARYAGRFAGSAPAATRFAPPPITHTTSLRPLGVTVPVVSWFVKFAGCAPTARAQRSLISVGSMVWLKT